MSPIEPDIIKYIDKTVERAVDLAVDCAVDRAVKKSMKEVRKENMEFRVEIRGLLREFQEENMRHMTALREGFRDDLRIVIDSVKSRTTHEEVMEMIRTENMHRAAETQLFFEEMRALRNVSTNHEKRIVKLEHKTV